MLKPVRIIVCFFFCLIVSAAHAKFEPLQLQGQTLDDDYAHITKRLEELNTELEPQLRNQLDHRQARRKIYIPKAKREAVREYKELRKRYFQIKPYHELKQALLQTYLDFAKPKDMQALEHEAERLALGLIPEIARLKKKYKSIIMPIVHNMMIDIGVRKRGACKHWAEDLLDYLRTQDRTFFKVTWGQANAEKFTEHNVAVILPTGGQFTDGLIIDPWRTSGKPYWIGTTKDSHYKWQPWDYYGMW